MNWRQAYFRQAESDYSVFADLNNPRQPLCHRLHYLQMAAEKLAKSFMYADTAPPERMTHRVLVSFLKLSKGRPEIRDAMGYSNNYPAYVSYVDSLLATAEHVEQLAPVGTDCKTLNAEYPWQKSASDPVTCPCLYEYPEFPMTDMTRFMALVSRLLRIGRALLHIS